MNTSENVAPKGAMLLNFPAESETGRNGKAKQGETEWPRGIRLFDLKNRPKRPYALQWRVAGAAKTKTFKTKEARETFARSLVGEVKKVGVLAFKLDESEARQWRAFRADLGDVPLDRVLAVWRKHGERTAELTVADAVKLYLAEKAVAVSPAALLHYKIVLDRFASHFAGRDAGGITREEIAAWLAGMGGADWTRLTALKRARGLFSWLKLARKVTESPCDGVTAPRIVAGEVGLLTVKQGRSLFANSKQHREIAGRLALEAFAGLRASSAAKVCAADISFSLRGITLPAAKIKTTKRQFIDGLPDNLWAWLKWSDPSKWEMDKRQYEHAKELAFARAKCPHPHNALRHSFCSYHIASNKDAARTAVILCHTSPKTLWAHYRGNATERDGRAWFRISP